MPSWRFFEDVAQVPKLYFRYSQVENPQEWTPWHNFENKYPEEGKNRSWRQVFYNPQENLSLYWGMQIYNLMVLLAQTSLTPGQLRELEPYQNIRTMLYHHIVKKNQSICKFQFRLSMQNLEFTNLDAVKITQQNLTPHFLILVNQSKDGEIVFKDELS